MRRGRGGGGQLFFYDPMCWELLFHFTAASEQHSAFLPLGARFKWDLGFLKKSANTFDTLVFFITVSLTGENTPGRWREKFEAQLKADPTVNDPRHHLCYHRFSVFKGRLSSTSVKFYLPPEESTSARHHDSEILCHLRHGDRVRSPPDSGDRPGRSPSLPNNDTQPAKKGELYRVNVIITVVLSVSRFFLSLFSHDLSQLRVSNVSSAVANHAHSASRW